MASENESPEMSTINQIQLPNGSIYGFEDIEAREAASSKADKTLATTSTNGLMSAADKSKLDGIGAGANVKSVNGRTGAVTLSKADVGLGNVDNTSDADKPISTATQTALDKKADKTIATASADGLMSKTDKAKLDGITGQVTADKVYAPDHTTDLVQYGAAQIIVQQILSQIPDYPLASQWSNGLMSAVDKKAVNREFFRMLPKGGTVIPNGANLNSTAYLKVGNYYQPAIVNTTNMTNIPIKAAFMMYVLSPLSEDYDNESTAQWVYRLRIFIDYTGQYMFSQLVSSDTTPGSFTYGPWIKLTNSNDLAAVSKIINDHIANKSNPHAVTKAQVGLGSVANLDQSKAIKSITRSGTTFTATALDGTTSTFTQQDNNTTYGVATSSADGLMSKTDKAKLDGITGQVTADKVYAPDHTTDLVQYGAAQIIVQQILSQIPDYPLASQWSNGLMSAVDKKAVNREFFRMVSKGGTYIPANADLNSIEYLKVGDYYNSFLGEVQTMKNCPAGPFIMYVLSPLSGSYDDESTRTHVYRLRIFVEFTGENIFVQKVSSGETAGSFTYGPWVKMTNSNDLGAVSEIINTHIANKSNPHKVTKDQVGLGSVANLDQSKAIKSITRSGTTFTATALDGTTTTFTQQDTNTTYPIVTTSADGLMSKEDKTKLDSLSDSGIHYVPFKLVDDTSCSTTDSINTVVSMLQANKPVQASVNADGKVISLPVFMYDAGEIMFRNDEMYIIWADTLAIYGYTLSDKLQDNDTTETSGQAALDAHMGKVLSDRINAVKTGAIDQIVKNTAQIETAGTATNAHSVGEYVMISNALYKVTASVAKGDTWTIGTNVTATNIGSEIRSLESNLANKLYPIGSIYLTVNYTNPSILFGGTWERIKDRFLLAAGNTYAAGSTGGWDTHIHKYGFQYGAFFGSISMEKDDQSGALQGGTGNPVGSTVAGQAHSLVNNNVAQDTKNIDNTHYKSIADTSSASNMPPYLAVYAWKRTA